MSKELKELKLAMVKHCLMLLTILSVCACVGSINSAQPKQRSSSSVLSANTAANAELTHAQYLQQALYNTPYAALVKITSVEVIVLPDTDSSDDYSEQKLIYHAEVLQSFSGNKSTSISYIMYAEAGDALVYPKDPFIVTLCESTDGLYWPGVGASFPANDQLIYLAQQHAKSLDSSQNNSDALSDGANKLSDSYSHCQ